MFNGLVDFMAYAYYFVAKSRNSGMSYDEVSAVAAGARTVCMNARKVLRSNTGADDVTAEDEKTLEAAALVGNHIDDMLQLMVQQEII